MKKGRRNQSSAFSFIHEFFRNSFFYYTQSFHLPILTIENPIERLIWDFFGHRSSGPLLKENSFTGRKADIQINCISQACLEPLLIFR